MSLDAIFGENESDSKKETDNLNEDLDFLMNTLNPPTLMDGMTKYIENTMDELNDKFDMDLPVSREIGMQWLDHKLSPIKDFASGLMDTFSSITQQIKGALMGLINFAVDLEHIDISDKMNQSLQTLKWLLFCFCSRWLHHYWSIFAQCFQCHPIRGVQSICRWPPR